MYRLSEKKQIPSGSPIVIADFTAKCDAIEYMDYLAIKHRKMRTLVDLRWTLYNTDFEVVYTVEYHAESMTRLIKKNDRKALNDMHQRAKAGEVIRLI